MEGLPDDVTLEPELVRSASTGDAQALRLLLVRMLPALARVVRQERREHQQLWESTSDLVNSVCRELLDDLSHLEFKGEAAFAAMLWERAKHKVVDRARFHAAQRRDRRRAVGLDDVGAAAALAAGSPSPSDAAMAVERRLLVEAAMAKLRDDDREILRLWIDEKLGHAEIAARLGISEGASRVRLNRARARLAELLPDEAGAE